MLGFTNPFLSAFVGTLLVGVVLPVMLVLLWIYIMWGRRAFLKAEGQSSGKGVENWLAGFWSMITASKTTAIAGLLLGIVAGLYMLVMIGI